MSAAASPVREGLLSASDRVDAHMGIGIAGKPLGIIGGALFDEAPNATIRTAKLALSIIGALATIPLFAYCAVTISATMLTAATTQLLLAVVVFANTLQTDLRYPDQLAAAKEDCKTLSYEQIAKKYGESSLVRFNLLDQDNDRTNTVIYGELALAARDKTLVTDTNWNELEKFDSREELRSALPNGLATVPLTKLATIITNTIAKVGSGDRHAVKLAWLPLKEGI